MHEILKKKQTRGKRMPGPDWSSPRNHRVALNGLEATRACRALRIARNGRSGSPRVADAQNGRSSLSNSRRLLEMAARAYACPVEPSHDRCHSFVWFLVVYWALARQ